FVQLSARTQNDGPRLLAQKLPERDNQPRIIDGPERVRNITSLFRCFTVMSDRSDHPSVPTYLRRPSCFSVRLERRFSVPACNLTERWSQRRSREARSRAEPRAAASLRRAWRARRALDLDGPLRPAQRLIRLGASELPLPLPTIPTARREAEAGSPSKSVTTTPSIAVILLTCGQSAGSHAGCRHRPSGITCCGSAAAEESPRPSLRLSGCTGSWRHHRRDVQGNAAEVLRGKLQIRPGRQRRSVPQDVTDCLEGHCGAQQADRSWAWLKTGSHWTGLTRPGTDDDTLTFFQGARDGSMRWGGGDAASERPQGPGRSGVGADGDN